ncbi:MAG: MarR family winged helix-turn-helix transcriptional regulator [Bacillota bacterium]
MNKLEKVMHSYEWVNEIANKTIIELKKAADMLEEIHNDFFSKFDISNTKFNVLVILYKGPEEGMMLSEIGEQMLVTKANITGLVDRLEKHGYVSRIPDQMDRRKIIARITETGRSFTEEVMEKYTRWTIDIMAGLDAEEKNHLVNILRKMQQEIIKTQTI